MTALIKKYPEAAVTAVLFAALAVVYSLVTPIFEASDEISHYPVIAHIAATGKLPVQEPGVETLWEQEGSQPPLYYLISAGLTRWIDTSDLETIRWRNPHAKLGIPLDPDNKNMVIHTEAERFPWQGTVLAVHLIRLFSVALATGSVILVYAVVREAWPEERWIAALAMTLAAFNPMFLFISGSVNNDNLTIFLSTWTLLLLVRILKDGIQTRRAAALAVILSLATITKISGLTLVPLTGLVLLIHGVRTGEWRQVILTGLEIAGAWAVLAGWWYLRNIMLYGELLGTNTHVSIVGGREIDLWNLRREWYGFWVAYWALFGSVDILADRIVYVFYAALSWIAVIGLATWVGVKLRGKAGKALLIPGLMALQIVVVFVAVIRWTLTTYASQGRLMFPVISLISGLMALGLLHWLPERFRPVIAGVVGLPMLAISILSPFRYIAPAYAPPPVVDALPGEAMPTEVWFDGLELVGVKVDSVTVEEGGRVPITVYWRVNQPLEKNYSIYLHALGREFSEIGKIDTYPGGGALPTSRMKPGEIIEDRYTIELDAGIDTPTAVRVIIGAALWDGEAYRFVQPVAENGEQMESIIVEAGIVYPEDGSPCGDLLPENASLAATFDHGIELWAAPLPSARAGDRLPVTLTWKHGESSTPDNLTVFVHLIDSDGELVTQADGPPLNGDYPTSLWRRACQVADTHILELPEDLGAGEYTILAGFYDASDPAYTRLPAYDLDGSPYPNYAVPVGVIRVEAP